MNNTQSIPEVIDEIFLVVYVKISLYISTKEFESLERQEEEIWQI